MPDLTCLEICAGAGGQSLGLEQAGYAHVAAVALRLVADCEPAAVMLENVRGLSTARFARYREQVLDRLHDLGYQTDWQVLNASEFGVPQLRPRFILVALRAPAYRHFEWPAPVRTPPTVGETLHGHMAADGWPGAAAWARMANGIGPTLVAGSRKHGGPDLAPPAQAAQPDRWLRAV